MSRPTHRKPITSAIRAHAYLVCLTVALFACAAVGTAQAQCVGDCDENCQVSVNELVLGVNIGLDRQVVDACLSFDEDESDTVAVNELVRGVNNALRGCGEDCVAKPSGTRTATPTATTTPPDSESTTTPTTGTPAPTAVSTATRTGAVVPTATRNGVPTPQGGLTVGSSIAADGTTLRISFNGVVDEGSGLNPRNYNLIQKDYPNAGGPKVLSARFALLCDGGDRAGQTCNDTWQTGLSDETGGTARAAACPNGTCSSEDRTNVVLSTSAHAGLVYLLRVTGVKDTAGSLILSTPPPLGTMPRNEAFYNGIVPAAVWHCPQTTAQQTIEMHSCEPKLCGDNCHGADCSCPSGDSCVLQAIDCDGDKLTDDVEQAGWDVDITTGTSQVCDPRARPTLVERKRVTSDPYDPDTDNDGLSDKDEKNSTTAGTTSNPRQPDTDLDDLDDYFEAVLWRIDPSNVDCDGDGVKDGKEVTEYGTSPALPDSDADGESDANDFVQRLSDPRFADLPTFEIQVKNPDVSLVGSWQVQQSNNVVQEKKYDESFALGNTASTSQTRNDTTTTEWYAKASAKAEASVGYPAGFVGSISVTAEAGISKGNKNEVEKVRAEMTVQSHDKTTASGLQAQSGQTLVNSVTSAKVTADLLITNTGPKEISVDDITLRMRTPDPDNPGEFKTIITLDQKSPTGPIILSTGATSGVGQEAFFEKELEGRSREFIDALLSNPRSVIFDVSGFKLKSPSSDTKYYSEKETAIIDNTTQVTVDFDGVRNALRFFVASGIGSSVRVRDTNDNGTIDDQDNAEHVLWQPDPEDASAPATYLYPRLTEALAAKPLAGENSQVRYGLDFTLDPVTGQFTSIEGVDTDIPHRRAWIVITSDDQTASVSYHPNVRPEEVLMRPGLRVWVSYVQDFDGDGVPRSVEDVYGSSDSDADTDDDALTDFEEIYGYNCNPVQGCQLAQVSIKDNAGVLTPFKAHSNPILADTDGDGLKDDEEHAMGTAPDRRDTDGDGAFDKDELTDGSEPLVWELCGARTFHFESHVTTIPIFGTIFAAAGGTQNGGDAKCSVTIAAPVTTVAGQGQVSPPNPEFTVIDKTGYTECTTVGLTCRVTSCVTARGEVGGDCFPPFDYQGFHYPGGARCHLNDPSEPVISGTAVWDVKCKWKAS